MCDIMKTKIEILKKELLQINKLERRLENIGGIIMGIEVMEVNVVENGGKYKELLTKILAYDNNLSDEDYKQISYDFNDAGILCTKGIDDIYSQMSCEFFRKKEYATTVN